MSETLIFCQSYANYIVFNNCSHHIFTSTQVHLLPSITTDVPTIPCESRRPTPISIYATSTFNSRTSAVSKASKNLKQKRKHGRMLTTEAKPDIGIKRTPHEPKKSFVHYTSEDDPLRSMD
ncbi:hypothetical protein TNCV_3421041 [Trichonephila clavipes]|nr:hypothetical protein TNCV_3421041 [Trichonephila clavipes]